MPSFSSFDIISVVVPKPKIFFCIPASAADAAAVNPNEIETFLANGLIKKKICNLLIIINVEN